MLRLNSKTKLTPRYLWILRVKEEHDMMILRSFYRSNMAYEASRHYRHQNNPIAQMLDILNQLPKSSCQFLVLHPIIQP